MPRMKPQKFVDLLCHRLNFIQNPPIQRVGLHFYIWVFFKKNERLIFGQRCFVRKFVVRKINCLKICLSENKFVYSKLNVAEQRDWEHRQLVSYDYSHKNVQTFGDQFGFLWCLPDVTRAFLGSATSQNLKIIEKNDFKSKIQVFGQNFHKI